MTWMVEAGTLSGSFAKMAGAQTLWPSSVAFPAIEQVSVSEVEWPWLKSALTFNTAIVGDRLICCATSCAAFPFLPSIFFLPRMYHLFTEIFPYYSSLKTLSTQPTWPLTKPGLSRCCCLPCLPGHCLALMIHKIVLRQGFSDFLMVCMELLLVISAFRNACTCLEFGCLSFLFGNKFEWNFIRCASPKWISLFCAQRKLSGSEGPL